MSDPNIRKLAIPKLTYSKYCSKCNYCVKAEWAKNKGVEWGQLTVYCCANGGLYTDCGKTFCPHGISYAVKLGQEEPVFNPEDWKPERFNKQKPFIYNNQLDDNNGEENPKPSKQRKL